VGEIGGFRRAAHEERPHSHAGLQEVIAVAATVVLTVEATDEQDIQPLSFKFKSNNTAFCIQSQYSAKKSTENGPFTRKFEGEKKIVGKNKQKK